MCPGCYKDNVEGYCTRCRKLLFDGAKISHLLPFDAPKPENLEAYQQKSKKLSISGMQLKYSLRLENKELKLVDSGGTHIIKPIPPTTLLLHPEIAPENEHLTMQIAEQVFGIKTAANALIYFKDGQPAYITRRFDVKPDGTKYLQEDMAQISGRSKQTQKQGEDFKYDGSYDEIGNMIKDHVAAYPPALERLFQLVLFNYLFSNADAHLKNFSLIETDMRDYTLAPAYDLLCTLLHLPNESDMALDLYGGDHNSPFYSHYGFFGQPDFRLFAKKLGLQSIRITRLITKLLTGRQEVLSMVNRSFLPADQKSAYINQYQQKLRRMGMTEQIIAAYINPKYPSVYAPTGKPLQLTFTTGETMVGYFDSSVDSTILAKENKYNFVRLQTGKKIDPPVIIEADLLTDLKFVE